MPIISDAEEGIRYIRLTDAIGIAEAADLKKALMDAIGSSPRVRVQLGAATAMDVTTAQLLHTATSFAAAAEVDLKVEGKLDEGIVDAFSSSGLLPSLNFIEEGAGGRNRSD